MEDIIYFLSDLLPILMIALIISTIYQNKTPIDSPETRSYKHYLFKTIAGKIFIVFMLTLIAFFIAATFKL